MSTNIRTTINRRYLLGINDEPKKHLPPILGYAREPLVSLEIACEPLLNIVSRLPPHIWTAKQNSKYPSDGLSQDESAAIHLYTMEWVKEEEDADSNGSLYVHLNRTLRMSDRTVLKPWFRYLKLFLTGLAKLKVNPDQIVWRGIPGNYSNDYLLGSEVIWWGFSSCTTSLNVLESPLYLGKIGAKTLFSIETLNGRALHNHSQFTAEDEIVLLPGTILEVKSRLSPSSDLHIIHLHQKRPSFDLIEPPFHGAQLLPPIPPDFSMDIADNNADVSKPIYRPWYKRKAWYITICAIIIIIAVIALGAGLGSRKQKDQTTTMTTLFQTQTTSRTSEATTTISRHPLSSSGATATSIDEFYTDDGAIATSSDESYTDDGAIATNIDEFYSSTEATATSNYQFFTFTWVTFTFGGRVYNGGRDFNPNSYYRLTTQWQSNNKSLAVLDDGINNNQLILADTGSYSGQYWKITIIEYEFYRLTTQWQGINKSLDVVNDRINNDQLILADTDSYSGQYWKITPTSNGFYRLTTRWQGDKKSLAVVNDGNNNNQLILAETSDSAEQYWKITSVTYQ